MASEAPEVVPTTAPAAPPAETAVETPAAPVEEKAAPVAGSKTVLILGASYAGVSCAHYFLKHVLPTLPNKESYTVKLVAPSSKFYARPGTPRAIASHKLMPVDKMFHDIAAGFKSYPAEQFKFVQAEATEMDEKARTVVISANGEKETIHYAGLIIATGTRTVSPVMGLMGDAKLTEDAQKQFQDALPNAKTIVLSGGGPAAVEAAGELASAVNGSAKITIITSDSKLLPNLRPAIAAKADALLKKMGVEIIYNTKVESAAPESAGITNITEKAVLNLSNGETREADLYLPAHGVKPNTDFMPTHLLNEKGLVLANAKSLRVDEAGQGVFTVGDVSSVPRWGIMDIYTSVPIVMSNLKRDLAAEGEKPTGADREWKANLKETQLVCIGPKAGTGAIFGIKLPGFAVKMIKGKDYFTSRAPSIVDGSHWAKESKWNGA